MPQIRLIHWKESEARERAALLENLGYNVDFGPVNPEVLKTLRHSAPDAIVIDLSRLPSQGRDVALNIRGFKSTRSTPIVFIEGDPEKTFRVRELLPDATFTTWDQIEPALKEALAHPATIVKIPSSSFAAYATAPLIQKLGIREGSHVSLVGAPEGFSAILGTIPSGACLVEGIDLTCDLTLWFARSRQDLDDGIDQMRAAAAKDGLWILWPKLGSGFTTDLTQGIVRKAGLAHGLVDYKISAIDATWSGLRFTLRKQNIL